jgi:tRNA(adenine34) deaminase
MHTLPSTDEDFMRLAIEEAEKGNREPGGGEVGCVIVKDGKVVASGHNEAKRLYDPTAHAEIVTLRELGQLFKELEFPGCTLYCTLQPCAMCAGACLWAKISRIVYGAKRKDVDARYFAVEHLDASDLFADAYAETIKIQGGVLEQDCARFYDPPSRHTCGS